MYHQFYVLYNMKKQQKVYLEVYNKLF